MTYANVVLVIGLFAVLGGGAYAATSIVDEDGVIHACYTTKGKAKGAVRVVKAGARCRRNETALSWNQQGEEGRAGG